ncbi:MAG TPA: hypothetical protein DCP61_04425, partial [Treponema sp.]|nr:hypothetical protein [Treponema sp.]
MIIRGSAVPLEASLREHQPWFDSAAGSFAARAPTVVDVIPGLTRNLWKVGGGLVQTLNQV